MRALVIAPQPFYSPRGTPFSVYHRLAVAAELGVQSDLVTYGEGDDVRIPGLRIYRIPHPAGFGPVPIGPSWRKLCLDILMAAWCIGLLLRRRYDVVHAHEEAVFLCLPLRWVFRFRLVYDMHSSLPQQLLNFGFTRSRLLLGLFTWLEQWSLRQADAVITICPWLAEYALARMEDPDRHSMIENSLLDEVRVVERPGRRDPAARGPSPHPPRDPWPPGRPGIVYAGTLEPYQGIDLLLRAFGRLRSHLPEAFLLVIGGAPDQVDHYGERAAELGIAEHLHFTGQLPQSLARDLVRGARVQVSPRLHGTNTPLKIYESLHSGIALVATAIESHTQVLDDRVAFLAKPDPEDLARTLLEALTRDAERDARCAAARSLYRERYARDVYVDKMRSLLARIR